MTLNLRALTKTVAAAVVVCGMGMTSLANAAVIITFGQNTPIAQNWNAIMTFRYTTAPEHEKDRNINPLGFQVVNYRSDPEA